MEGVGGGHGIRVHLESIDGHINRRHALGGAVGAGEHVCARELLERDVVVVLEEEVGHHLGVLVRLGRAVRAKRLVGRLRAEELVAVGVGDDGLRG